MPLINCPVCNTQISDQAVSCPKCGHPMRDEEGRKRGKLSEPVSLGWMAIAVIVTVLGLFFLLSTCKWAPVV